MPKVLANNATSTLASSLTNVATSLSVQPGDGAKFPVTSATDTFYATLIKTVGGVPQYEIVLVTSRSGDTFTITRAQDGTTALSFSAADRVELRLNKAVMDQYAINGEVIRSKNFVDKVVTNAAATGAITLDFSLGDIFDLTLSGNVTSVTLSNLPTLSGEEFLFAVRIKQGGSAFSFAWFSGITWITSGATAPAAPSANKTIEVVFSTKNGTTFLGRKGASD